MQITSVTVAFGATVNLGNFSSGRIDVTKTALLDEGEDQKAATAALALECRNEVRGHALDFFKNQGAQIQEIFKGLPVEVQKQITEQS
jgi:hypothetical protein